MAKKEDKKTPKAKVVEKPVVAAVPVVKVAAPKAAPLFQNLSDGTSAMDISGGGCVICKDGALVHVPNVRVVAFADGNKLVAEK